jgi:hypothetical protein
MLTGAQVFFADLRALYCDDHWNTSAGGEALDRPATIADLETRQFSALTKNLVDLGRSRAAAA